MCTCYPVLLFLMWWNVQMMKITIQTLFHHNLFLLGNTETVQAELSRVESFVLRDELCLREMSPFALAWVNASAVSWSFSLLIVIVWLSGSCECSLSQCFSVLIAAVGEANLLLPSSASTECERLTFLSLMTNRPLIIVCQVGFQAIQIWRVSDYLCGCYW